MKKTKQLKKETKKETKKEETISSRFTFKNVMMWFLAIVLVTSMVLPAVIGFM